MKYFTISSTKIMNEFSFLSVRGALNSLYDPSYNCGVIISFFLGNFLSGLDHAKASLIGPVIFMIIMFLLPESPEYWSNRNKAKVNKMTDSKRKTQLLQTFFIFFQTFNYCSVQLERIDSTKEVL